ncbi:hypothetical protein [Streptomyces sp. NPDC006855]|uniref:hypothetical protein n=1 Tax=Streptomyces sp. NPDC006855 TaxID=3364765 RepID=UPI00367A5441
MVRLETVREDLLEEVLAWLLKFSMYRLLAEKDDPARPPWKVLEKRKHGLVVRGRGAWRQADTLGGQYVPSFSLPIRLFAEAKFTRIKVGLPAVRNGHGVVPVHFGSVAQCGDDVFSEALPEGAFLLQLRDLLDLGVYSGCSGVRACPSDLSDQPGAPRLPAAAQSGEGIGQVGLRRHEAAAAQSATHCARDSQLPLVTDPLDDLAAGLCRRSIARSRLVRDGVRHVADSRK